MSLATKDGSLVIKDGVLAQDCNCCEKGPCCKPDKHCTNDTTPSECQAVNGSWSSARLYGPCPPSGCCCRVTDTPPNCLLGGCRPQQIDVSFTFNAPTQIISQYKASEDAYYYWQAPAVSFSGSATLTRFYYIGYFFAHDPTGTTGFDLGLGQGFANASSASVVFDERYLTAQFVFHRRVTVANLSHPETCNNYLYYPGYPVRGKTAGWGTLTTDTGPLQGIQADGITGSYIQYTADLSFPETQINSKCFCYGIGETNSSASQEGHIDFSVLSLPCEQRPAVINQSTVARDAGRSSTATGVAKLTINDAR